MVDFDPNPTQWLDRTCNGSKPIFFPKSPSVSPSTLRRRPRRCCFCLFPTPSRPPCFRHRRRCSPKSRFTVTALTDGSSPLLVDGSPTWVIILVDRLTRVFSATGRISALQWPSTPWPRTSGHSHGRTASCSTRLAWRDHRVEASGYRR